MTTPVCAKIAEAIAERRSEGRPRSSQWPTLERLMREHGYTDAALGKLIGRSARTVQDWRRGIYQPRPAHLCAACRVLEVEPCELLKDAPFLSQNLS